MQIMTRRALGLAALALMVTASAVWAQQAPPVRVRGEITKVDGNTLSVKSRDGENLTVKLAEPPRIAAMVKASLADIKEGLVHRRVGHAAAGRHPEGLSPFTSSWIRRRASSPTGSVRWDSRPGSTMTNANVATTVAGKDGQDLLVKYKDGEKKVVVPPGTPIAKYVPGSAADLKVGAKVFVGAAKKEADGTLTAPNIAVGRDIDPPQ